MNESNKVIKTGLAYVYDDDDEADDEDSRGDLLTKNANIRLRLAAAQAEVEELKEIIYKVIAYCASGRVVRLGEIEAFTPEINVEDVKKWRKAIEGGAQ